MTSVLDRPGWTALSTRHADLAIGNGRARRFNPGISAFAGTPDNEPESLEALAALARPGEPMIVAQAGPTGIPKGFRAATTTPLVQMILEDQVEPIADPRIVRLGWPDAEEMFALATLAKPGPFTLKSQALGSFWGVRENGRIVAMAGERLKQPGYVELSGVCVHPDFRGRGLARSLSQFVSYQIAAAGDTPYLHTFSGNAPAISLYQSLGFRHRIDLTVVALVPGA
jgi:predicted GNAT family acetyltransferase